MQTAADESSQALLGNVAGTENSRPPTVIAALSRVAVFAATLIVSLAHSAEPSKPVPASVAPVYAEAKEAMEAADFARAAQILEDALRELPAQTDGIHLLNLALGIAYLRADQPENAITPLEKTPAPEAVPLLADALRRAGRLVDARRFYEKASIGESINARYSRARISELDAATADKPDLLFAAADGFAALGPEDAAYFDEASKLYEAIARNRQWRGEPTAHAIFSLGEIQRQRKSYPEAIAYYQRCFVSWAKFTQWGARSYLRAAECFEALGRRPDAIAHLREMMRKADKYGRLPEFAEAKTKLRSWGEIVQ